MEPLAIALGYRFTVDDEEKLLRQICVYLFEKLRDVLLYRMPNIGKIKLEIVVHRHITKPGDLLPRQRNITSDFGSKFLRLFTDNNELEDDSALQHLILFKISECLVATKDHDFVGLIENIVQIEIAIFHRW